MAGKENRARQTNLGRAASFPPASKVPGPRPHLCCSPTLPLRLQSAAGSEGCGGGSGLQTVLPCRQPASQPPSLLPPLVRARIASKRLQEPSAAEELPGPASAEGPQSWRGAAAVPKALFRRADHAALPWLQAATAGEAGRRAAGRQGAALVAPLPLGGTAPRLREPERGAQEGQVPALRSAPARPTIAPAGSGAPASLQPRAHARLPLPAGVPASTAAPHETAAIPRLLGGWGGCVRARVCVSVCV